jgi:hypothetical protein
MANIPVNFGGVILTANQSSSGNFAGIMCLGTGSVTNAAGSVISYLGYGNGLLSDGSANTAYMPATTTTTASVVITSASLAPFITPTGSFVVNGTTINITSNTAPAPTATTLSIRSQINLESYTQDFTNAFWDKVGGGVTATSSVTIAPDGTLTGNQITEVGGGGNVAHHIHDLAGSYIPVIGTTYYMSAYIKRPPVNADSYAQLTFWIAGFGSNAYVNFNIENATIGTSGTAIVDKGIIDAGNGWYRIYASAPATATGASGWQICFVSSPSASRGESYVVPLGSEESFYMWGAQVEKSGLTNYQATLTTPPSSSNLITASFNTYAPSYPTLKYITAAASGSTSTGLIFNTTTSLPGLLGNTYYITSGSTTTNFSGGTNVPALTLRAGDNVPLFITACGVSASSAPVLLYT